MKNGLARRRIKRPQRSAARRVKKRSASWTNSELRAVMTEYQPYKAARSIHSYARRVESLARAVVCDKSRPARSFRADPARRQMSPAWSYFAAARPDALLPP